MGFFRAPQVVLMCIESREPLDFRQMLHIGDKDDENQGFPGGAVVENLPANAGDMGSSPGLGRSHMPRSN